TFAERWPEDGNPQQPVSHLAATGPDQQAVVSARDTGANRLTVPGSLGLLDATIDRILALDRDRSAGNQTTGTLVLAGADHPVTAYGAGQHQGAGRSEEHTSELQSRFDLVCRLLLEKKKKKNNIKVCNT